MTTEILLYGVLSLLFIIFIVLLFILRQLSQLGTAIAPRLDAIEKAQERIEQSVRSEMAQNREESGRAAREQRQELSEAFNTFSEAAQQRMMVVAKMQKGQLEAFSVQLGAFVKDSGDRLDGIRAASDTGAKQLREEVVGTIHKLVRNHHPDHGRTGGRSAGSA